MSVFRMCFFALKLIWGKKCPSFYSGNNSFTSGKHSSQLPIFPEVYVLAKTLPHSAQWSHSKRIQELHLRGLKLLKGTWKQSLSLQSSLWINCRTSGLVSFVEMFGNWQKTTHSILAQMGERGMMILTCFVVMGPGHLYGVRCEAKVQTLTGLKCCVEALRKLSKRIATNRN